MPKLRCVNIDWLEVCCIEPLPCLGQIVEGADGVWHYPNRVVPRDADYFRSCGFVVDERSYGTPTYKEMFTVCNGRERLVEVRRNPYSKKSEGGIFEDRMCHLRLPNRQLYTHHPVEFLIEFIKRHDYEYRSTTRIDFCLDFNEFDNRRNVPKFVREYMAGGYFKMGQCQIHAHGLDCWPLREYWSLRWGSMTSPLTVKLYNKSFELRSLPANQQKPYIMDAWRDAQLDIERPVYRVEFSIKSSTLKALAHKKKEKPLSLDFWAYPSRSHVLFTFMALSDKYFDFRKAEYINGKPQRRDRCQRVELFVATREEKGYTPLRFVCKPTPLRTEKALVNRLFEIFEDINTYTWEDRERARTCAALIMERANYKALGMELPRIDERLERSMLKKELNPKDFNRLFSMLSDMKQSTIF